MGEKVAWGEKGLKVPTPPKSYLLSRCFIIQLNNWFFNLLNDRFLHVRQWRSHTTSDFPTTGNYGSTGSTTSEMNW